MEESFELHLRLIGTAYLFRGLLIAGPNAPRSAAPAVKF